MSAPATTIKQLGALRNTIAFTICHTTNTVATQRATIYRRLESFVMPHDLADLNDREAARVWG
jgi:hypothetical protein